MTTEDQLAGVLAHEIVHSIEGHYLQKISKDKSTDLSAASILNSILKDISTTRIFEAEADIMAVTRLLGISGYNPYEVKELFNSLRGDSKQGESYSPTHGSEFDRNMQINLVGNKIDLQGSNKKPTLINSEVKHEISNIINKIKNYSKQIDLKILNNNKINPANLDIVLQEFEKKKTLSSIEKINTFIKTCYNMCTEEVNSYEHRKFIGKNRDKADQAKASSKKTSRTSYTYKGTFTDNVYPSLNKALHTVKKSFSGSPEEEESTLTCTALYLTSILSINPFHQKNYQLIDFKFNDEFFVDEVSALIEGKGLEPFLKALKNPLWQEIFKEQLDPKICLLGLRDLFIFAAQQTSIFEDENEELNLKLLLIKYQELHKAFNTLLERGEEEDLQSSSYDLLRSLNFEEELTIKIFGESQIFFEKIMSKEITSDEIAIEILNYQKYDSDGDIFSDYIKILSEEGASDFTQRIARVAEKGGDPKSKLQALKYIFKIYLKLDDKFKNTLLKSQIEELVERLQGYWDGLDTDQYLAERYKETMDFYCKSRADNFISQDFELYFTLDFYENLNSISRVDKNLAFELLSKVLNSGTELSPRKYFRDFAKHTSMEEGDTFNNLYQLIKNLSRQAENDVEKLLVTALFYDINKQTYAQGVLVERISKELNTRYSLQKFLEEYGSWIRDPSVIIEKLIDLSRTPRELNKTAQFIYDFYKNSSLSKGVNINLLDGISHNISDKFELLKNGVLSGRKDEPLLKNAFDRWYSFWRDELANELNLIDKVLSTEEQFTQSDIERWLEGWNEEIFSLMKETNTKIGLELLSPRAAVNELYNLPSTLKTLLVYKLFAGEKGVIFDDKKMIQLAKTMITEKVAIDENSEAEVMKVVKSIIGSSSPEMLLTLILQFVAENSFTNPNSDTKVNILMSNENLARDNLKYGWDPLELKKLNPHLDFNREYIKSDIDIDIDIVEVEDDNFNIYNSELNSTDVLKLLKLEPLIPSPTTLIYDKVIRIAFSTNTSYLYNPEEEDNAIKIFQIPEEEIRSTLKKIEPFTALKSFIEQSGTLVRATQLLLQLFEIPEKARTRLNSVFDAAQSASKLAVWEVIQRETGDFFNEGDRLLYKLGGGSKNTTYLLERETGEKLAIKVLNPNITVHTQEMLELLEKTINDLIEKDPENQYYLSLKNFLLPKLKEWEFQDIEDTSFFELDNQFKKQNQGFKSKNIKEIEIYIPETYQIEAFNKSKEEIHRFVKIEEFCNGPTINSLTISDKTDINTGIISRGDYQKITELLFENYQHQLKNGIVHSNPHPGNFIVMPDEHGHVSKIAIIDRGFYQELSSGDMELFREVIIKSYLPFFDPVKTLVSYFAKDLAKDELMESIEKVKSELKGINWKDPKNLPKIMFTLTNNNIDIPLRFVLISAGVQTLTNMKEFKL